MALPQPQVRSLQSPRVSAGEFTPFAEPAFIGVPRPVEGA